MKKLTMEQLKQKDEEHTKLSQEIDKQMEKLSKKSQTFLNNKKDIEDDSDGFYYRPMIYCHFSFENLRDDILLR